MLDSRPDPRTSESELRLLADNAPVMIRRSGTDKLCDWFNKPWLDFTGRSLEQELGNGWVAGIHPEDVDRCLTVYGGSVERREAFSMEYRLKRHDGAYRWLLDNGRPFYRCTEFAGYFGSCVDVTEQHAREDSLRTLAAEQEELLHEVHHRINNDLQALNALLRLRRKTADAGGKRLLDELGVRVAAMAAVQRYLHGGDHGAPLSLRQLILAVLPEVTSSRACVEPEDFPISSQEAANIGLAVAEIVGMLDPDAPQVSIALDGSSRTILVRGRVSGDAPEFGRQLVQAYARAANARVEDRGGDQRGICMALRLSSGG